MADQKITNPRVLIVDDEQMIATTLEVILNRSGFEARAVFSGEEAVASVEKFQPDILISDVVMSGLTGIEAAILTRNKDAQDAVRKTREVLARTDRLLSYKISPSLSSSRPLLLVVNRCNLISVSLF